MESKIEPWLDNQNHTTTTTTTTTTATDSPETYQSKRLKHKNSTWFSVIVFVKSTAGIVNFVMPSYFYQCGILLASLIWALVLANLFFCNLLVLRVAEDRSRKTPYYDLNTLDCLISRLTRSRLVNTALGAFVKVARLTRL